MKIFTIQAHYRMPDTNYPTSDVFEVAAATPKAAERKVNQWMKKYREWAVNPTFERLNYTSSMALILN